MRKFDQTAAEQSRAEDPDWSAVQEYICSDMAGVLSTPRVSASASFYLRKLRTYMYGIFSGQANRHSLGFWDETMVTLPLDSLHRCPWGRCFEAIAHA